MEIERLPGDLLRVVRELHPDDEVLIAISSDITGNGTYGEDWLVVTDQHILTFSADNKQPSHDLRVDRLDKVVAENVSGAGFVQAQTAAGT